MPITYKIDESIGLHLEWWVGEITPSEMSQHWKTVIHDPGFSSVRVALTDIRDAEPTFKAAELWKAVDADFRESIGLRSHSIAILVSTDEQEQAAKRWIAIVPTTTKAQVFYDHTQAMKWLNASQLPNAED